MFEIGDGGVWIRLGSDDSIECCKWNYCCCFFCVINLFYGYCCVEFICIGKNGYVWIIMCGWCVICWCECVWSC